MLVLESSMQSYFREALVAAMQESKIEPTEPAQVYLVHLLNEFSRSEKAFAGTDHGEKIIMVDLLKRALAADDYEALQIFRHLGDTSLYLLGFFKESEIQRLVNETYYRGIGAQAYLHASCLSRSYGASSAALFHELSDHFDEMVTVVENISKYGETKNNH